MLMNLLPRAGLTYEQLMPLYGNMNEPPRGKVTLWELAQIKSQNLCHKTIFYRLPSLSATDWESAVSAPQAICP
ncbi:MAG: hypothetical protein M5U34_26875 [Chloroflexi bacterium]|nr:hypothetical protein [Chloroflexota bacterium]